MEPVDKQRSSWQVSRRSLFVGGAIGGGLLTAAAPPASAARRTGPVTLDEFLELSELLTDDVADLPEEAGAAYFAALTADPAHAEPLRLLAEAGVRAPDPPRTFAALVRSGALDEPAAAATAQRILELWYSGLLDGGTIDYLEALAWTTLDFPEPASTEIGFPKWERRP